MTLDFHLSQLTFFTACFIILARIYVINRAALLAHLQPFGPLPDTEKPRLSALLAQAGRKALRAIIFRVLRAMKKPTTPPICTSRADEKGGPRWML